MWWLISTVQVIHTVPVLQAAPEGQPGLNLASMATLREQRAAVASLARFVDGEGPISPPPVILSAQSSLCPAPALDRFRQHQVQAGETLDSIAAAYNLLPPTLLAANPGLRQGSLAVGTAIAIPPYDGVQVEVAAGQTWQEVADRYQVRADVLFEVNGCSAEVPTSLYIPGVNLFPGLTAATAAGNAANLSLPGYPLSPRGDVVVNYGWQPHPTLDELVFNSGITLAADPDAAVVAVADGTVAFAGNQPSLGNLVVINHRQGLQTRYANLADITVQVGQTLTQGATIGHLDAPPPGPAYLYFEVRLNSQQGWVAQDPTRYLPALSR